MRLVVFVPLKACVDPVEEAGFPRAVFVCPQVHLPCDWKLDTELGFIIAHALFSTTYEGVLRALTSIT